MRGTKYYLDCVRNLAETDPAMNRPHVKGRPKHSARPSIRPLAILRGDRRFGTGCRD